MVVCVVGSLVGVSETGFVLVGLWVLGAFVGDAVTGFTVVGLWVIGVLVTASVTGCTVIGLWVAETGCDGVGDNVFDVLAGALVTALVGDFVGL